MVALRVAPLASRLLCQTAFFLYMMVILVSLLPIYYPLHAVLLSPGPEWMNLHIAP